MNVTWKPPHAGFELLGAFKHTLKPSGLNEENSASYSSLISYENGRAFRSLHTFSSSSRRHLSLAHLNMTKQYQRHRLQPPHGMSKS